MQIDDIFKEVCNGIITVDSPVQSLTLIYGEEWYQSFASSKAPYPALILDPVTFTQNFITDTKVYDIRIAVLNISKLNEPYSFYKPIINEMYLLAKKFILSLEAYRDEYDRTPFKIYDLEFIEIHQTAKTVTPLTGMNVTFKIEMLYDESGCI